MVDSERTAVATALFQQADVAAAEVDEKPSGGRSRSGSRGSLGWRGGSSAERKSSLALGLGLLDRQLGVHWALTTDGTNNGSRKCVDSELVQKLLALYNKMHLGSFDPELQPNMEKDEAAFRTKAVNMVQFLKVWRQLACFIIAVEVCGVSPLFFLLFLCAC